MLHACLVFQSVCIEVNACTLGYGVLPVFTQMLGYRNVLANSRTIKEKKRVNVDAFISTILELGGVANETVLEAMSRMGMK